MSEHPTVDVSVREWPASPSCVTAAPLTVMRWPPLLGAMRAQDTTVSVARRIVCEYSLSGSASWGVPAGTVDPNSVSQEYPDASWRSVAHARSRLTPGCMLAAHVLYVPAGLVQENSLPVGWRSLGAWAELRITATWMSQDGVTTDGPRQWTLPMAGSTTGTWGGLEPEGFGAGFVRLREAVITGIEPPTFHTSPADREPFCELVTVDLEVEVRGGDRVVHAVVYEVPRLHTQDDDNEDPVSVHVAPSSDLPQTPGPQIEAPDQVSYEVHRHGTERLTQVASQHGEHLGPRVLHWSSYDPRVVDGWQETEQIPLTLPTDTFADIFDATMQEWDPSNPGWIVAGSMAQLHRYCEPVLIAGGRFAVIPVRVRVDARWSGTGSPSTIRLQSGPFEWIEIEFANDGVRETLEAVGLLESQVYGDHSWATLQAFAFTDSGCTFELFNISIDFGH